MAQWLFQVNVTYFDLERALSELNHITWKLSRFAKQVAPGDNVAVWQSGTNAGVYAIGRVDTLFVATRNRPNPGYWRDEYDWTFVGKTHAIVKIEKTLKRPLLKREILKYPELTDLAVVRAPIGTIFRMTQIEWDRISSLAATTS